MTSKHASEINRNQELNEEIPEMSQIDRLILETDGSMVPIVTTMDASETDDKTDRRKTRSLAWLSSLYTSEKLKVKSEK